MIRTVLRIGLVVFGGVIAARLVETYLTSERGKRSASQMGFVDLTTHQGVEMSQRHARTIASIIAGAIVAVQESATAGFANPRRAGWPERMMTCAQLFLAVGTIAKAVSDFIEERRRLMDEGKTI